jgi:hypothetical protein
MLLPPEQRICDDHRMIPRAAKYGLTVAALAAAVRLVVACGGSDAPADPDGGLDGGGDVTTDASSCPSGTTCGDGGVCAGGSCCAVERACGDACCGGSQICSFQKCVTPGGPCIESSDCAPNEYCDPSLGSNDGGAPLEAGCSGGKAPPQGRCLPKPPICSGDGGTDGGTGSCLDKCEYVPPTTKFDPVVKYAWGGNVTPPYASDVMMAPIVTQLDDDDCDGKITGEDIPDIVFSTFANGAYYKQGTLHAITIKNGAVSDKWSVPNAVQPGGGLASGDLTGDGVPEIVGCMDPGPSGNSCCDALAQNTGVVAYDAKGKVVWTQPDTTKVHCGYAAPAIGDLDGDGTPEVVVGLTILDGKTGAIKKELDPGTTWGARITALSDVDGDGLLDVVDGQRAYKATGAVIWDLRTGPDAIPFGYPAVGDFDKDQKPEVVIVASGGPHRAYVVKYDPQQASGAAIVRRDIDINNGVSTATFCNAGSEYGGGPPTIADFDGDGTPDVGVAGAVGYVVLSGAAIVNKNLTNAQTILWFKTTHDCSSAVTGSSVFDFNGDGKAEVIYSDEYHLWMYDGKTGTNLIPSTCNTTGTLWEYPLVADVDNDGQADIVVASNAYGITCPDDSTRQSGIRIFGSASGSWVRSRRIWNEHAYHITNVGEDGRIPKTELKNWTQPGLNNFRQNKQPGAEFAAVDAIVTLGVQCSPSYRMLATVRNVGQALMPAGAIVKFYEGTYPSGTLLGQTTTTTALGPAAAQSVELTLPNPPPTLLAGKAYATVEVPLPTHQCRTDNDHSPPVPGGCSGPN